MSSVSKNINKKKMFCCVLLFFSVRAFSVVSNCICCAASLPLYLFSSSIMPIFRQYIIKNSSPATQIEITTYMAALGFDSTEKKGCYTNSRYKVWDVLPRNVLKDNDGDIFVIDAEIELL